MNEKKNVLSNLLWRFAERIGAQGVTFVVSIVLARLLDSETYGIVALVTVFTTILQAFVDSGFGTALIQKKDADHLDFSSVFYFNVLICVVVYALLFCLAPFISEFYHIDELTPIVRVLGLTIVISGVKNIQQAYVSKTMQFKKFFFATLCGTVIAAVLGIVLAYQGYGVWALVIQQVINTFVDTLMLWITVKWRPRIEFSFVRLKKLFGFGWKMLISSLLDKTYNEIRQLLIGRVYSAGDLGFYNRGKQFPNLIVTNVNTSIDSVLLPAMAKSQDDVIAVKNMTRRSIKVSTYIMAPLMMGLAFVSKPLVITLLTSKWLPCVPYLQIFAITYMFMPIHTANLNAIKALGRGEVFLKLELMKKFIGIALLIASFKFGVMAIAISFFVSNVISQIINASPNRKLLGYAYLDQLKDILPYIVLSFFMGICIYPIVFLHIPMWVILIIQVLCGALIYWCGSVLLKFDSYYYLISVLAGFKKKK